MANVNKLKKAGRLGSPPAASEASGNLSAPETAPSHAAPEPGTYRHYDFRRRRSHRTVALGIKVSPEFDKRLREFADRDNLLIVEVLERALDSYEKTLR
jgi:hypothetical protein